MAYHRVKQTRVRFMMTLCTIQINFKKHQSLKKVTQINSVLQETANGTPLHLLNLKNSNCIRVKM